MKELRGKPESPGMSKLETARVASDLLASFLLGHWGRGEEAVLNPAAHCHAGLRQKHISRGAEWSKIPVTSV